MWCNLIHRRPIGEFTETNEILDVTNPQIGSWFKFESLNPLPGIYLKLAGEQVHRAWPHSGGKVYNVLIWKYQHLMIGGPLTPYEAGYVDALEGRCMEVQLRGQSKENLHSGNIWYQVNSRHITAYSEGHKDGLEDLKRDKNCHPTDTSPLAE